MRETFLLLIPALVPLAACDGTIDDPFPEKIHVERTVDPGQVEEGTEYVDLPSPDILGWQVEVNHRPEWIDYQTWVYDTWAPEEVEIVYEIEVARDAPPGRYDFDAVYEFRLAGDAFKREIQLHFQIHVGEAPADRPHRLTLTERVPLDEPEQLRVVAFE